MAGNLAFLSGGGSMGDLMRRHDWSTSPLGDPDGWPDTLKAAVATCLASKFPMVVWWGPKLIMLYNDAWQPILGETKHPQGLGRPGEESWPETWPIVGKEFEAALQGIASWSEDLLLASDRKGFIEECYFTYSHSPLRDAEGAVVGVHTAVAETTSNVLDRRRLAKLRDLSELTIAAASQPRPVNEVCTDLVSALCRENPDAPFALLYVGAGGHFPLCAVDGIDQAIVPGAVSMEESDVWGIGAVIGSGAVCSVAAPVGLSLPGRPWSEPVKKLVHLPLIAGRERSEIVGILSVGANSRLVLDVAYLGFLRLVAEQFAGSISTLRGIEKDARDANINAMLIRELQHRTRNLLTIVQSIADRTLAGSETLQDFRLGFNQRLAALSRVQALLSKADSVKVGIADLVKMQFAALGPETAKQVSASGPQISLPRVSVQIVALALHELTTNAIKHGALREPNGVIFVSWAKEKHATGEAMRFHWSERGQCDRSTPASNKGFGRLLIEDALPKQVGGVTTFSLGEQGLDCTIMMPLE